MTQDPHRTSWDSPGGEQPVEPSAGPSQPRVSEQPWTHGPGSGGWAQPTQPQPAQQPPVPPAPGYGPPPQVPGYGPPPHGYVGVPASTAPRTQVPNTSIVLLVISGVLTLLLSWSLVGLLYLAPAVLGVVAVVRGGSDPAGSRRLARTGWLVFGAVTVLLGLLLVVGAVLLFSLDGPPSGTSGGVSV